MFICSHSHACGGQRLILGLFFSFSPPYLLRQDLLLEPRAHHFDQSSQRTCSRNPFSSSPTLGLARAIASTWNIHGLYPCVLYIHFRDLKCSPYEIVASTQLLQCLYPQECCVFKASSHSSTLFFASSKKTDLDLFTQVIWLPKEHWFHGLIMKIPISSVNCW